LALSRAFAAVCTGGMKKSSETPSPTRTHFVADPSGARYQADSDGTGVARIRRYLSLRRPAATAPERVGRVVVGVDGSPSSIAALQRAAAIAEATGAAIRAVAVWQYPTGAMDVGDLLESAESDASEALASTVQLAFDERPPEWLSLVTREGSAAHVLIEESWGAEMLIVGSRGHSVIAGLFLGSVSAQCAERAHCPVLVMH
jgi:nucleotide-binding universal stress UspA family protein